MEQLLQIAKRSRFSNLSLEVALHSSPAGAEKTDGEIVLSPFVFPKERKGTFVMK